MRSIICALAAFFLFAGTTGAQGDAAATQPSAAAVERFGGEGRIGSEPPFPLHLELRRSGDAVSGTIVTPGANFELIEAHGADRISGRFRGDGGAGAMSFQINGDALAGSFDLEGQAGTLTARRTDRDAAVFFRAPEQRLDLTTAQWLEDLDRLVEILTHEHGAPFHRVSRESFMREVARVRAAMPRLTGVQVALEFRKLGAMIGDGHTSVALPRARPRFPVEAYWFEDGLRAVSLPSAHRALLGARLVAVDDMPVARVVARLRAFTGQGETEWAYRFAAPYLLNNPDVLDAAGIGTGPARSFTFELAGGRRQRIVLAATTDAGGRAILGGGLPLWQRNEDRQFWSEALADGSVYVNWRGYDGLAANGAALLQQLETRHPRRLVIDLRDSGGGDYTIGRAFIAEIQRRPWLNRRGVLYVLVGRTTFSAAMTNVVDFKRTTQAILVGEPAGAAPNNWQEVRHLHLPNSGFDVGVSTRYYTFLPGEIAVRPDRLVPPRPSDWGSPQDAAMRYIVGQPAPAG